MKQFYDRLFIKQGCTSEEVKIAYKKLAKKFHPDVNQNDDYIEEFKMILEAYESIISHLGDSIKTHSETKSDISKDPNKKKITDHFDYSAYSDEIEVENITFEIKETKFAKEISIHYRRIVADGVYLIIKLGIKNIDNEVRTLSFMDFKLYDYDLNCYSSLGREINFLNLSQKEMMFDKQCQPQIPTTGYLLFEVPNQKKYFLELYGGKIPGRPSYRKKIVPLPISESNP